MSVDGLSVNGLQISSNANADMQGLLERMPKIKHHDAFLHCLGIAAKNCSLKLPSHVYCKAKLLRPLVSRMS